MGLTLSLHSGGAWRLPRPDVFVSQGTSETSDPFVVCTQSTVDAFIRNLLPFLNGSHVFQSKTGNSIRELAKDRGLDFYLSDRGSGLGFAAEPILENYLNRAGINSVHAAATSLLAPNPRGLVASSYMLHPERIFHLETLKSRIERNRRPMNTSAQRGRPSCRCEDYVRWKPTLWMWLAGNLPRRKESTV